MISFALNLDATLIMTRKTDETISGSYVACAPVPKGIHVTQLIASLIPSYHGACLILATGTTTGQVFMADWSGTGTLAPLSPIQSQWENK